MRIAVINTKDVTCKIYTDIKRIEFDDINNVYLYNIGEYSRPHVINHLDYTDIDIKQEN